MKGEYLARQSVLKNKTTVSRMIKKEEKEPIKQRTILRLNSDNIFFILEESFKYPMKGSAKKYSRQIWHEPCFILL